MVKPITLPWGISSIGACLCGLPNAKAEAPQTAAGENLASGDHILLRPFMMTPGSLAQIPGPGSAIVARCALKMGAVEAVVGGYSF